MSQLLPEGNDLEELAKRVTDLELANRRLDLVASRFEGDAGTAGGGGPVLPMAAGKYYALTVGEKPATASCGTGFYRFSQCLAYRSMNITDLCFRFVANSSATSFQMGYVRSDAAGLPAGTITPIGTFAIPPANTTVTVPLGSFLVQSGHFWIVTKTIDSFGGGASASFAGRQRIRPQSLPVTDFANFFFGSPAHSLAAAAAHTAGLPANTTGLTYSLVSNPSPEFVIRFGSYA